MPELVNFKPVLTDKILSAELYNPHDHDFLYQREDGSMFIEKIRKDGTTYHTHE